MVFIKRTIKASLTDGNMTSVFQFHRIEDVIELRLENKSEK